MNRMIKKISFIILSLVLISLMIVSCKEKEVIYNIGDEVTIDGIKYKLYSTSELGTGVSYYGENHVSVRYYNPDGTLKNINEEDIYKKNDDRVGYLHKFYYYDMLNLDKYPDLTIDLIQNEYRNKNIHLEPFYFSYEETDIDTITEQNNMASLYPSQFLYVDDNGLAQNGNYFFSTNLIYDSLCQDEAYWAVVGYNYDDVKEDTLILHRIGDYQIVAIAYKALEGAPMKTLTVEAPTDEDLKEDKDGNYSYIPVLYYPYAISNCPNLVSISTFNGYFMPLSISNIPKIIDLNLAAKEGSCGDNGFFALDAAFYDLTIKNLKVNFLESVSMLDSKLAPNDYFNNEFNCGLGGCYNSIFTDCKINSFKALNITYESSGNDLYFFDGNLVAISYLYKEQVIINSITPTLINFKYQHDKVIHYQIYAHNLPLIKDGVCYNPYNTYIQANLKNQYLFTKNPSFLVVLPTIYHRGGENNIYRILESNYYCEDGYIKLKITGLFVKIQKCELYPNNDINCVHRIPAVTDIVLTVCEINDDCTYVVDDGTVIYDHNK